MKYILFSILAALGCVPLFAQNTDTIPDQKIEETVISANRTEERKRDIPQQIDVLSARRIAAMNAQTTADVLQNTGGVFVQKSQQGGGSPVLRGFEANKVLLVADGVRQNNAIFRSGHLQNIVTFDPAVLDRVEILHGAGSVIYGTDAIGGVISLFTKRPQLSESGRLEAKIGAFARFSTTNNGTTVHTNLNLGGKKWANFLAVTANDFGDLRSGARDLKCDTCRLGTYDGFGDRPFYVERVNGRDSVFENDRPDVQRISAYRQIDVLEKFLFAPGGPARHTLNLQFSTSSNVPRYDRLTETADGNPRFAEWYYGPQKRLMASYQLEYQANAKFADLIRLTPAFQKIEESRNDRRFGRAARNERTEDLGMFSANLDFFKLAAGHEIRYGAEFVRNKLVSKGLLRNVADGSTAPLQPRYPNGTYSTTGIYVSHRWEILGEKLILSDGLRFSTVAMDVRFDPRFFEIENLRDVRQSSNSLNFNLGLTANFPGGFRTAGLFSSGFRNPNIDDAGKIFENAAGTLTLPNADLKPEQVLHREMTLGYRAGDVFEVSATVFQSDLTDAIAARPTTYDGKNFIVFGGDTLLPVQNVNVAKARVQGFSATATARFVRFFSLGGQISWTEGRDRTADGPLDHIPPLLGRLRFGFERGACRAETDLLFNGWKHIEDYSPSGEDNQQYATPDGMPAWQMWNLRGAWKFAPKWRLQAAVENLLDVNYRAFASGINGAGRNFVVGIHYQ